MSLFSSAIPRPFVSLSITGGSIFSTNVGVPNEDKRLVLLKDIVLKEQKLLDNEFEGWQKLIQKNASFKERLSKIQLDSYIKVAERIINVDK